MTGKSSGPVVPCPWHCSYTDRCYAPQEKEWQEMILFSGVALGSFERMLTDEITSTSVLSSLSISLLFFNHVRISAMHAFIRWNVLVVLSSVNGLNDIYTCVSSAYKCSSTPCRRAISPRGAVYAVNKNPCGTPNWSRILSELSPFSWIIWQRSVRYKYWLAPLVYSFDRGNRHRVYYKGLLLNWINPNLNANHI